MIDRRQTLSLLAGAALAPSFARADTPSLASLAAARGMRFGGVAGITKGGLHDPKMAELLIRECDIIVPENELKMYAVQPQPGVWDFAAGDEILAFAQANKMAMRGHNLYWAKDQYTPKWLTGRDFGAQPRAAAEDILRDHIAHVCDHYGDRLTSWDVVNEAVDEKTGQVRDNLMLRALGPDYLRICFDAARQHLPKMQLVYNDYMDWTSGRAAHRKGVLDLLRWFRDNHVPVDALGIQGHVGTAQGAGQTMDPGSGGADIAAWKSFLTEVTAMGYDLLITEFDVNDRRVDGDIATRDQVVAETAKIFLDVTLSFKQVKDVLCWGLCDKYSWLQSTTPRADGLPLRPTLYDDQFQPKPLRAAFAAALQAAPDRT